MPSVSIQKVRQAEAPAGVAESVSNLFEAVRRRAYELFERRGYAKGWALDDWLQAERELLWSPLSEVVETEKHFQLRVAAPGLESKDVQVTVTPHWAMVQGESNQTREGQEGAVRFSEFSGRKIFRRFELPVPIDVDATTAKLEKGILEIRAVKGGAAPKPKKAVKRKTTGT